MHEGTFHYSAFNAGAKMVFPGGIAWMVRLPRVRKVNDCYADEKVAMELKALSLIRERTTIPVPKVYASGPAAHNPLDLILAPCAESQSSINSSYASCTT
jgi:hypothetical protein